MRAWVTSLACALAGCGAEAERSCPSGASLCGEACVDLVTDRDHCGVCGHACNGDGIGCFGGACTSPAPVAQARAFHALAVGPDGRLYVIGGRDALGELLGSVEAYDAATNRWTEVESIAPRWLLGAATHAGRLWAIGGSSSDPLHFTSAVDWVQSFDGERWSAGPKLSGPRRDAAVVAGPDSAIRAFGGYSTWAQSGPAWVLPGVDVLVGDTWQLESAKNAPPPRWGARAVVGPDARIYLLGGVRGPWGPIASFMGAVDVYDPATREWTTAAPMLHPRALGGAALGPDGRIYYAGGWEQRGAAKLATREVQAYDPLHNRWSEAPPLPSPRADTQAVTLPDGRIYVVSGTVGDAVTDHVLVYDPRREMWFW